jgi:hypothetical protein
MRQHFWDDDSGNHVLTAQRQCWDNNTPNKNKNKNKSKSNKNSSTYLLGDFHLASSQNPTQGSKAMLRTPKICASGKGPNNVGDFKSEATLGWFLNALVIRVSNLVDLFASS